MYNILLVCTIFFRQGCYAVGIILLGFTSDLTIYFMYIIFLFWFSVYILLYYIRMMYWVLIMYASSSLWTLVEKLPWMSGSTLVYSDVHIGASCSICLPTLWLVVYLTSEILDDYLIDLNLNYILVFSQLKLALRLYTWHAHWTIRTSWTGPSL